jgi:hypothetical protein
MIMTNDSGDVIYLENTGNKENKYERHKIGSVDMGKFGVGVSLVDVDMDGDLDIVAYSEKERKTFRNCMK